MDLPPRTAVLLETQFHICEAATWTALTEAYKTSETM